jgi:hypothetical protein
MKFHALLRLGFAALIVAMIPATGCLDDDPTLTYRYARPGDVTPNGDFRGVTTWTTWDEFLSLGDVRVAEDPERFIGELRDEDGGRDDDDDDYDDDDRWDDDDYDDDDRWDDDRDLRALDADGLAQALQDGRWQGAEIIVANALMPLELVKIQAATGKVQVAIDRRFAPEDAPVSVSTLRRPLDADVIYDALAGLVDDELFEPLFWIATQPRLYDPNFPGFGDPESTGFTLRLLVPGFEPFICLLPREFMPEGPRDALGELIDEVRALADRIADADAELLSQRFIAEALGRGAYARLALDETRRESLAGASLDGWIVRADTDGWTQGGVMWASPWFAIVSPIETFDTDLAPSRVSGVINDIVVVDGLFDVEPGRATGDFAEKWWRFSFALVVDGVEHRLGLRILEGEGKRNRIVTAARDALIGLGEAALNESDDPAPDRPDRPVRPVRPSPGGVR